MLKRQIIDGHLHLGVDNFWNITGSLDEYVKHARELGITDGLVMSVPCPVLNVGGYKMAGVFAVYEEGSPEDWGICQEIVGEGNRHSYIPPQQNPYQLANQITHQKSLEAQNKGIRLHFVPIVHPGFDTVEYWEHLIEWYEPIAIKVHGLSAIIHPQDIPDEFWNIIRQYNIPLIVHTDTYRGKEKADLTNVFRQYNTPLEWLKVLQKNGVRAYLAHGIRLCQDSARIINESSDFVVGLGPDSRLATQTDQMYSNEPYLQKLFDMVSIDKLCFDTDYPWNTLGDKDDVLEWGSINRIKALGLTDKEIEKVLCRNAKNFFRL